MKVSRFALIASLTALLVAALSGCSGTAAPGGGPKTLTVGFTLEPDTLDLTTSSAASIPQLLLYNVYETLVRMDATGAIKPLLATDYTVSSDGKRYTFDLDPKATFASGTPVDAAAVVAGINRMRQATSATIKTQMSVIADVAAVNPTTVVVTLSQPSNFWLFNMTTTAGIIVDPAITDLATQPMGSGPYELETWTKGDSITLKKNPAYWGAPGRFDQVVFRYMADPNAMVSAMLSGGLDIAAELTSPDSLTRFADTSKYTVIQGTTNGEVTLGFNFDRQPLRSLQVRQAICHAIDRQALLDSVWGGKGALIGSMVAPTDPYYQDLSGTYPYDPAKARQLLAAAGYATGLTLDLKVPITPYATPAARVVASDLEAVGITVKVTELDFSGQWLPDVFLGGDYDLTIVDHAEPRDIVNFADPTYYWHYNNPEFADLIGQADAAPYDQFITDMRQAAQMLADDAAADWLFLFPNLVVARAGISGIPDNAITPSFDLTTIDATD